LTKRNPFPFLRCMQLMRVAIAHDLLRQNDEGLATMGRAWCGFSLTERGSAKGFCTLRSDYMVTNGSHFVRHATHTAAQPFKLFAQPFTHSINIPLPLLPLPLISPSINPPCHSAIPLPICAKKAL